jgi:arylsulfatase
MRPIALLPRRVFRVSGVLLRLATWVPLALPVLFACRQDPVEGPHVWRPGDGLLERLEQAVVLEWPDSNLADDVAACWDGDPLGTVKLRSAAIKTSAWVPGELVLEQLLPARTLASGRRPRLWEAPAVLSELASVDLADMSFWIDSEQLPVSDPSVDDVPPLVVAWDDDVLMLVAVSESVPEGVRVVRPVAAADVFGEHIARTAADRPSASSLGRRVRTGGNTRAGLLLPGPGRLSFPGAVLNADTLHLGVSLVSRSLGVAPGNALTSGPSRSDGVVCALDIVALPTGGLAQAGRSGKGTRLWERSLSVADGLLQVQVDLSAWRGRSVALQLVTEPGPAGDPVDDLVEWTGLRMAGTPSRAPHSPHLVLIDVDTLRADAVGAGSSEGGVATRSLTPRIDAWAGEHALVFDDVLSVASWTLPATATMLTGLAVHQHRLDHKNRSLSPGVVSLAARLSDAGYETRASTEGGYVGPSFGFDAGFELYESRSQRELDWDASLDWISARRSERPFFLFLQTYMVHAPYPHDERLDDPAAPYTGPLAGHGVGYQEVIHPYERGELDLSLEDQAYVRRMYRAGVASMDELVGAFIERVEQVLDGEAFVLVLTSDHGEAFFEHGLIDHHKGLYDEVLRVPLLLRLPDGPVGRRSEPASLIDLVPTLLDALGLPPGNDLPGRSLLQPRRESVPRVAQHSENARSLTLGDDKLIVGRTHALQDPDLTVQLFDLSSDPGEKLDRASDDPDLVRRMDDRLAGWLQAWPAPAELRGGSVSLDDRARADLEALGYLGDDDER